MAFSLIFAFMLLVFWRPQEWLLPWIYGYPVLDVMFYLSVLGLLVEVREGKAIIPMRAPQTYLIPGLWFAALMSHVGNTYFAGLMDTIVPTFKPCIYTFVLFCVLDRLPRFRLVARTFVFMGCFMAVHALLQQARGYGFAHQGLIHDYRGPRSLFFGIFEDPNDLAQMFIICIPFVFVITRRATPFSFLLGVGLMVLLINGLLATQSRGGLIGLAAVVGAMIMMRLPDRWLPYAAGFGALCALLAVPSVGAFGFLEDSAVDRVSFWGSANWAFKTNPVFGVGYSMMSEYIPGGRAVHNAFVLCYAELGLFGYWFWFGLIFVGMVGTWRTWCSLRRPRTADERWFRRLAGASMVSMVGFAASGYFLTRAYVYPVFFLFALLGAIPVAAGRRLRMEEGPRLVRPRRDLLVSTVASFGSVAYIYATIVLVNKARGL